MKVVKRIFTILFWIILLIIAFYSTFVIIQKLIWKDKTPSFFGYKNFIVLTGSMKPTLNEGDIVFVKETSDIKLNDIISFRLRDSVITHRVIEIKEDYNAKFYVTKGDANNEKDGEVVNINEIEGKYCFKIPFLGSIILFFQKPIGITILFILMLLFLSISFIKSEKKNI